MVVCTRSTGSAVYPSPRVQCFVAPNCACNPALENSTLSKGYIIIIFHVLQEQKCYQELGANYLDERERLALEKRLVKRLEKLGYLVSLQPTGQVA